MWIRDVLDLGRFYVSVKAMAKEGNTIRAMFLDQGTYFLTH